jgi:predicted ATPase
MVGRREELRWMNAALDRVAGGSPVTLMIGGDAGIGKSRLVSEFTAGATAGTTATARVLTGCCPELGDIGLPFAPFTDVLTDLAADHGPAAALSAAGARVPSAAGGGLLSWLLDPGGPAPAGNARQARSRLFVEMLSLLEQLARRQPAVLVIEDAQWAGESARDLLSFLIDSQQSMNGVLIIVTYRSDELRRGHPMCGLLSQLGRLSWVQRAELAGLSHGETAELIGRLHGAEPAPTLADEVHRRTEGNPLFVEELVRGHGRGPAAVRSRAGVAAAPRAGGMVTGSRDLMLAAVRRLPEQTQDVLRAASAGGRRTGRRLLAAMTGMSVAALDSCLGPAVADGVLTADQDSCVFRHALIAEAIHQDLLPCEHNTAHHRLAAALREDSSLAPPAWAAIQQAEHWQHVHDTGLALTSAWQAAADAGRVLASAEQLALLTRVLELWPSVPDAEQLTSTDHEHVLRQAAEVAETIGERHLSTALASQITPCP